MFLQWFALSVQAADGFETVREIGGCVIAMRPEGSPDGAAMRADCRWPEVAPPALIAMIDRYEDYPAFVFPVDAARIERRQGERTLVYQRQSIPGLSDREVLLWMSRAQAADGTVRTSWVTAAEEPLALAPGAIRTPKNVGFWQVGPDPAGGTHVIHEVALDAGGVVPRWIVNLVRTRAFAKIMSDVRACAVR